MKNVHVTGNVYVLGVLVPKVFRLMEPCSAK